MEYKTHFEPVETAKEEPTNSGVQFCYDTNHGLPYAVAYRFNHITGQWSTEEGDGRHPQEWLKPRPDTVLMTREEVEKVVRDAYYAGRKWQHGADKTAPDQETYINNLFK